MPCAYSTTEMIELAAHHEIDVRAGQQAFRRLDLHLRPYEGDFDSGLFLFHRPRHAQIAVEAHRGGEQHHKLVVLRDLHYFRWGGVPRRRIQQSAALQHSGGISQPDGIPVGLDLASGGPTGPRAAVKLLESSADSKTKSSLQTACTITPSGLPVRRINTTQTANT